MFERIIQIAAFFLIVISVSGCGINTYYTYSPARKEHRAVVYQIYSTTPSVSEHLDSGPSYDVYTRFSGPDPVSDINAQLSWSDHGKTIVIPLRASNMNYDDRDDFKHESSWDAPFIPESVDEIILTFSFTLNRAGYKESFTKQLALQKKRHLNFWIVRKG